MNDPELDESVDEDAADDGSNFTFTTLARNSMPRGPLNEDDTETSDVKVYMAVVWQQNKLGAAFYDVDSSVLFVMHDCSESTDFVNCKMALQQIAPTAVVSMAKLDLRFREFLKGLSEETLVDSDTGSRTESDSLNGEARNTTPSTSNTRSPHSSNNQSSFAMPYRLEMMPNQDFGYTPAKQRLMLINLPEMPDSMTEVERHVYFSAIFPMESVNSFRATGALLKFLDQKRIGVELEDGGVSTPILAIKQFSLSHVMLLNRDAFYGLQIFSPLSHPSVYKAAYRNSEKEGLSLRLMFQSLCKSAVGRKCMSLWLLRPLQDLALINQRLTAVTYFTQPKHGDVVHDLQACVGRIRDVSRVLFRMVHAPIATSEWKSFYDNLRACCELVEICRRHSGKLHVFDKVLGANSSSGANNPAARLMQLVEAANLIMRVIDFQQSATEGRCVVNSNVDAQLDEKKRVYASIYGIMATVAQEESVDLMPYVSGEILVVYEPQLGFFVTIPETDEMRMSRSFELPGLEYRFVSNEIVHYKSRRTRELDEKMGDVFSEIRDQEVAVLMRLQNAMLQITEPLCHVIECASSIDCLLAFSTCAIQNNYCRPFVSEEIGYHILNGRHPLQEQTCSQFIPNNTKMDAENGKVLIVTGPNSSGKSVYLKQIAIIVYMAHLGSFVPAEAATIGLTDRIYTRIKTMDSVSAGLSAFVVDLNQTIPATLYATKRSLAILDEFGKGTDAVDGAAILAATINCWLKTPENCPHLVVSTHLLDVVNFNLISNSQLVRYLTTEVSRQPDGKIVFLYKLVAGRADGSCAALIAQQGGLPETVVARAKEITENYTALKPIPNRPLDEEVLAWSEAILARFTAIKLGKNNALHFLKEIRELSPRF